MIPRVTRAGAKRSGMTPGAFALMASQDDIERSLATEPLPGTVSPGLPSAPACDLDTPASYAEAMAGEHREIWGSAMDAEFGGLSASETFQEAAAS